MGWTKRGLPRWFSGKTCPPVQEMYVPSLGWKDPLEKGMATHPSMLVWRILWTEEPNSLQSMRPQKDTIEVTETAGMHE